MMFSCTVQQTISKDTYLIEGENFNVTFYSQLDDIKEVWNLCCGENLFMNLPFLKAIEIAPPSNTTFRYALLREGTETVGIVYFQINHINLYESLRLEVERPEGAWDKFVHSVKSVIAKRLNGRLLVAGNMTLTGSNAFTFKKNIAKDRQMKIVGQVADHLVCHLKNEGIKPWAILVKDFFVNTDFDTEIPGYARFTVEPNMVLDINTNWNNFEDYLADMRSKYRVRVRRARKKASELEKRELSLEEIHAYSDKISDLYRSVADQAGFNLFILPKNYFYSLKNQLGENMSIVGYFEESQMVGFYTYIKAGNDLDAHFLGYDAECNRCSQLYLNMLYDLVEDAIRLRMDRLVMSRTALEIKSSVGAEPYDMALYLKGTNKLLNIGVAKILEFLKPNSEWQPRNPFKD
mgnify:CR=1 FL=1